MVPVDNARFRDSSATESAPRRRLRRGAAKHDRGRSFGRNGSAVRRRAMGTGIYLTLLKPGSSYRRRPLPVCVQVHGGPADILIGARSQVHGKMRRPSLLRADPAAAVRCFQRRLRTG